MAMEARIIDDWEQVGLHPMGTTTEQLGWLRQALAGIKAEQRRLAADMKRRMRELHATKQEADRLRAALQAHQWGKRSDLVTVFQESKARAEALRLEVEAAQRQTARFAAQVERQRAVLREVADHLAQPTSDQRRQQMLTRLREALEAGEPPRPAA